MTRRLAIAAVAAAAIPLLAADAAMACSCARPEGGGTPSIRSADGVFIGRLLAVRAMAGAGRKASPGDSFGPADFVYRVGRVYNGGPGLRRGRRVKVRSNRSSAACGLPDRRGRLYGLFVDRHRGRWHGSLCGVVAPGQLRDPEDGSAAGGGAGCR